MVGPYRVTRLLGSGGMGKVYLARDDRLGREVAIKCFEKQRSETLAKRFRREARLIAGLNHTNIVGVYDILKQDASDFLVMEYVKGSNLKEFLENHAPDRHEKLQIMLHILAGLREAHANGVVHRDLKSENILVAENGAVKIADFGIARSLRKIPDSESLTEPQTMLGTYRCMSPEQARGEPAGTASDLFSFGVLFYEVFVGKSPFSGNNELATLQRIINHQQSPLCDLDPSIPLPLSQLVDHLLQKDAALRPRNAAEVIAAIEAEAPTTAASFDDSATATAIATVRVTDKKARRLWPLVSMGGLLLVILALLLFRSPSPPPPIHVVVVKPQIIGKVSSADLLVQNTRLALVRTLLRLDGVTTLSAAEVDRSAGPWVELARALAADEVVVADLDCSASVWIMTLNRIRGSDGVLLWTDRFEVPKLAETAYARAIGAHLQRGFSDHASKRKKRQLDVRNEDYLTYLRTHKRFYEGQRKATEQMLANLTEIHAGSPRFLDAYLLDINVTVSRFNENGQPALLERAYTAAGEARLLAPNEPEPIHGELECAFVEGDMNRIKRLIEELQEIDPGSVPLLVYKSRMHEREKRPKQALAEMRAAIERHPSWRRLYNLARMELRLGEADAARKTLEQLLERAPDSTHGQALAAQVELVNGSPERAAVLYQKIVARSPGFAELNNLALAWFLIGRFDSAQDTFKRALDLAPDNPLACLNLADATLLVGHREQALELYRQVVDLVQARLSSGEVNWQLQSARAQALAHLGISQNAVAAVQDALSLASGDSQAAYEAAVVFAILDDRASAAFQAQRALDLGYQPRWFSFPWFDALRKDDRFDLNLPEPTQSIK